MQRTTASLSDSAGGEGAPAGHATLGSGTRVDPPHLSTRAEEPDQVTLPPDAAQPDSAALAWERVQRHAAELADGLRELQADLDRRERQLHEQIAALEHERRQFRLWTQSAEAELEARRQLIDERLRTPVEDPFVRPS